MKKSLVSVIIPFYNRPEKTILAIESVLVQTHEMFELIIVNDGSSDISFTKSPLFSDSRIRLISHEMNMGANAARNTGLEYASGNFIAFLDSDDTWHPKKLEIMINKLEKNPDYGVAYCDTNNFLNGNLKFTTKAKHTGDIYKYLLKENMVGSASVPITKKSVFDNVGGLDINLKSAQDWDLWLRIAETGTQFLAVNEALVNYTLPNNEEHISGSISSFLDGRFDFITKHKKKYLDSNKNALSTIYSNMGFILNERFNDKIKALSCFTKSIYYKPTRVKSWKGLMSVFLPKYFIQKSK